MYQFINNKLVLSVKDWCAAGLTIKQFRHDSADGYLEIFRRGINGNTMIDVESIKRAERLRVIEAAYGKIEKSKPHTNYAVEIDMTARTWFTSYIKPDGSRLELAQINEYTNTASVFNALHRGMFKQQEAYAKIGKRLKKKIFWDSILEWYTGVSVEYGCKIYSNVRSLERAFKRYINGSYASLLHGNVGTEHARIVSFSMENLFLSIYRTHDKPFVGDVHQIYLDFVNGSKKLFDKETGEVYNPEYFRDKEGKPLEVSRTTIWNYLNNVINNTAIMPTATETLTMLTKNAQNTTGTAVNTL